MVHCLVSIEIIVKDSILKQTLLDYLLNKSLYYYKRNIHTMYYMTAYDFLFLYAHRLLYYTAFHENIII